MVRRGILLALVGAGCVHAVVAAEAKAVRVRASLALAPCTEAAARAFAATGGRTLALEVGAPDDATTDVLVASSVEITRALESGLATDETEVEVARVPWVLVLADRAPAVKNLAEAGQAGIEVELPAGPAAYEARRVLAGSSARVRERHDVQSLRRAEAALVPLSLAGPGRRLAMPEVPPLAAHAAVGARAASPEAGRAFVSFLGTDRGRVAFAACAAGSR
jgi:hypothetical protein